MCIEVGSNDPTFYRGLNMQCNTCKRQFRNGEHVTATVLSVYHNLEKPAADQFKYAIEKPYACLNICHLSCEGHCEA